MNKEDFGCLFTAFFFLFLSFLSIQQFSQKDMTKEQFGGIGIAVAQLFDSEAKNNRGELVVLDVIKGTPAFEKKIQRGDMITHVDGESVKGKNFEYLILKKLRGAVGSNINITIKRFGVKSSSDVKLTRRVIY